MPLQSPGHHGRARFALTASSPADAPSEARRWDVELAAFVLFGSSPWRSFYEHGAWHVAYVRRANLTWFVETFGDVDVAIFRAHSASGPDTADGIGFERMK